MKSFSALDHLIEVRSRGLGDVQALEAALTAIEEQLALARAKFQTADRLVKTIAPQASSALGASARVHSSVGAGESTRAAILSVLNAVAPAALTTMEIADRVAERIHRQFDTPHERRQWKHNTISTELKGYAKRGWVQRVATAERSRSALWRATAPATGESPRPNRIDSLASRKHMKV